MPRISAVLPRCHPVFSKAARICCRSTSLSDPGLDGAGIEPTSVPGNVGKTTAEIGDGEYTGGRVTSGGSSAKVMRPLFERMTALSKQFFNCRTFPGQLYDRNAANVSSVSSGGVVPATCFSKYFVSGSMSSGLSRSGARLI